MSSVKILPPEVISKIAAGEVIERPASALKEIIENSIDAQATMIDILLEGAGKKLIQIKDNGNGIEQIDLDQIFFRHATSKISSINDLDSILSLGFRGEALYSIGAISDTLVKSKTKDQDSGWQIHWRGGKKISTKPAAISDHGTEIEIRELFYNTPARRNFMKSNTTEINQILNIFIPYCLIHNNINFTLTHQKRKLIDLKNVDCYKTRCAQTLNVDEQFLLESQMDYPDQETSIHLILGDINIKRTRRDMQFIFVNGRPVQNKSINYHLNQIFRLILPSNYFGLFAAMITMPSEDIDVNIHPAKREIKILDERSLCTILRTQAEQTLMNGGNIQKALIKNQTGKTDTQRALFSMSSSEDSFDALGQRNSNDEDSLSSTNESTAYSYPHKHHEHQHLFPSQENIFNNKDDIQSKLENARFIGIFMRKFILFETGKTLLVVDQHAAQERIMYEQLIRQLNNGTLEIQRLLSPVILSLTPKEVLSWEQTHDKLTKIGFENNQWDETAIAIHSHPLIIRDIEYSVRSLLAGDEFENYNHEQMARRACRSSIMAGDSLKPEQAEFQREQLLQCLDPFTCPHGRPTVIEMSEDFLDKQFLRT